MKESVMAIPNLNASGYRLETIDEEIFRLIAERMRIAKDVVRFKKANGGKIVRPEIESRRIAQVATLANEIGLNSDFARAVEHLLIGESCKIQIDEFQSDEASTLPETSDERYAVLKDNLVRLTRAVARTYTSSGGDTAPATKLYVEYENAHILGQIKELALEHRGNALDLGCAAGRITRLLSPHFSTVTGYDLSQDMVDEAWRRCDQKGFANHNMQFVQHDLDFGIPEESSSVDMVVMGLGTASDIRNLRNLLREIGRVLKPDGAFVLSFYNADALMYTPGYIPFDSSLNARINTDQSCLQLYVPPSSTDDGEPIPGEEYLVYARAYSWGEIETMVGSPLRINYYRTYPTLASVMPRVLLRNPALDPVLQRLERAVEYGGAGAYYLISGVKE